MKNSGLKNRFPAWVHTFWGLDWFACMVCGFNNWNALHHIISPSDHCYVAGKHNESILNSCPIHNYRHPNADQMKSQGYSGQGIDRDCHINNDPWLHSHVSELLQKTRDALEDLGYELKPIDEEFIRIYNDLYE